MERKRKVRRRKIVPNPIDKRETKWYPKRVQEGYELALLGLKDVDIAMEMDINLRTLQKWKHAHPEFYEALQDGKAKADTKVVSALYQRAVGYEMTDYQVHNKKVTEYNEFGNKIKEYTVKEIVKVPKVLPPDVKAAIKWLQARQPEKWGDRKHIEVQNNVNIAIQNNTIDFSDISDEELALVKKLGMIPAIQDTISEAKIIED